MKFFQCFFVWSVVFVLTKSDTYIYKTGWLDRVVQYFKDRFVTDVHEKLPPIKFEATLVKAPPGYVDSNQWDYDSALRLLKLIRSNKKTRPLAIALRRSLSPTMGNGRRYYNTYNSFPKLNPEQDVFYSDSEYDFGEPGGPYDNLPSNSIPGDVEDDAVVQISNPVEARLPSAHISVRMLREILEARAMAGRIMPTTKDFTIPWQKSSKKTTPKGDASTKAPAADNGNKTATDTSNKTDDKPADEDKKADGDKTVNNDANKTDGASGNDTGDSNTTS